MDDIIEQYFMKCDFDDECDICGNKAHEQSYASGSYEEVDSYICKPCALKYIAALKNRNKNARCGEMEF